MKKISLMVLLSILFFYTPVAQAKGWLNGAIEAQGALSAALRESPDEESEIIMNLYNGFTFGTEEEADWIYIYPRWSSYDGIKLKDISGYVRRGDINMQQQGYLDVKKETPFATVKTADGSGEVRVLDWRDEASAVIATYLDGAVIQIAGEADEWYFIDMGNIRGFIPKADVELSEIEPASFYHFQVQGVVKLNQQLDEFIYHTYPSLSAPVEVLDDPRKVKEPLREYIAVFGDWYEIKAHDGRISFVHKKYLDE